MNSKIVILGVIAVFCISSLAHGFPMEEDEELVDVSAPTRDRREISDFSIEELADVSAPTIRHKRATCDLLSGFGVNHSACAAHCVLIGRKGGYCNSQAVCVCRN